jgi:hypothetical protein
VGKTKDESTLIASINNAELDILIAKLALSKEHQNLKQLVLTIFL